MSKSKLSDLESRYKRAVDACRAVCEFADETSNCGICAEGEDDDDHNSSCPVPQCRQVLEDFDAAQKG